MSASFIKAPASVTESLTESLIDYSVRTNNNKYKSSPLPGRNTETFSVPFVDTLVLIMQCPQKPSVNTPIVSSSQSVIDNAVSASMNHWCRVGIVEDNFFKSEQTGIHRSIFLSNNEDLTAIAMLHGLSFTPEISDDYCLKHLIYHIIHRHCCKPPSKLDVSAHTVCTEISAGFFTIHDLSDCILDSILKLSPKKLFEIANSIDLSLNVTVQSPHCHSWCDAVLRIKSFCKTKHISESQLQELFLTDFEDMSCVAAVSVAHSHGIEILSQLKKDDVKDLIMEHLVNSWCTQNILIDGAVVWKCSLWICHTDQHCIWTWTFQAVCSKANHGYGCFHWYPQVYLWEYLCIIHIHGCHYSQMQMLAGAGLAS